MDKGSKILFVYNSDSSIYSVISDFANKIFSPETYECNLCLLTYGNLLMKRKWKDFVTTLPYKANFFLRDKFIEKFPQRVDDNFPAVYILNNSSSISMIVSADEINSTNSLGTLINLISNKMNNIEG